MGESWIQRVGKRYRHQLQVGANKLADQPLFNEPDEIEKHNIGCVDTELDSLVLGSEIGIFLTSKRARPALVVGNQVIGYVDGDSATDIQEQVSKRECWPVLLRTKVVARGVRTDTVIISPVVDRARNR